MPPVENPQPRGGLEVCLYCCLKCVDRRAALQDTTILNISLKDSPGLVSIVKPVPRLPERIPCPECHPFQQLPIEADIGLPADKPVRTIRRGTPVLCKQRSRCYVGRRC